MDVVETAHFHREEGEEDGVPATPAFPAIATGAVAGVVVDMDAGGVSVLDLSLLVRSNMAAIPCIWDSFLGARKAVLEVHVSNYGEYLPQSSTGQASSIKHRAG